MAIEEGTMGKQEARDWFYNQCAKKSCWGKKLQAYSVAIAVLDKSLEADRVALAAYAAMMKGDRHED